MKAFKAGIQSFIVSCESAEACGPGEASLHHPSLGQQHKSTFGHGVLDDAEADAVLFRGLGGVFSAVTLVHIRKLDRVAGDLLHLFSQRGDLLAVAL